MFLILTFLASMLASASNVKLELSDEQRQRIDKTCIEWFEKKNIDAATHYDCVSECAVRVDMGTFQCPEYCDELCKALLPVTRGAVSGLCPDLRRYLLANPLDATKIFSARKRALRLTRKATGRSSGNDESDAVRHALLAMGLAEDLGLERAKRLLDAHESCAPRNKFTEMDLHNNNVSLDHWGSRKQKTKMSDEDLIAAALSLLLNGKLRVEEPYKKIK